MLCFFCSTTPLLPSSGLHILTFNIQIDLEIVEELDNAFVFSCDLKDEDNGNWLAVYSTDVPNNLSVKYKFDMTNYTTQMLTADMNQNNYEYKEGELEKIASKYHKQPLCLILIYFMLKIIMKVKKKKYLCMFL